MNRNLGVVVLVVAVGLIGISLGFFWTGNYSRQVNQEQADLITIESSDLKAGSENTLILSVALGNKSSGVQKYPLLELTLLDRDSKAVARSVIKLEEFVDSIEYRHISARDTKNITLLIDASAVPEKSGYRAYVFYASSEPERMHSQLNSHAIRVISGSIDSASKVSANSVTEAESAVSSNEVNALKISADDGNRNNWASQGYGVNEETRVFCTADRFGKIVNCSIDILGRASTGEKSAPIWSLTRLKVCGNEHPDMLMLKAFEGPMSPVRIFFDNDADYIETLGKNETDLISRYIEGKLETKLQKAKSVKVVHSVRNGHEVSFHYDMIGYHKALVLITAACK